MNRFLLILCCLYICVQSQGQSVGINTTGSNPDASAILDVSSNSKGMLIPRMDGLQRTGIGSPALGLLVFDTDTESFWYRGTLGWLELREGNIDNLSDTDGNTKIQVEESTNEDAIRMDINNTEHLVMNENAFGLLNIDIPNSGFNVFLGRRAGMNTEFSNSPYYGASNVFIGSNTGEKNERGKFNLFAGSTAGQDNVNGEANVYLGSGAGSDNVDGGNNVFVGLNSAGSQTDGNANVYLGSNAGNFRTSGSHNVFLGNWAGRSSGTGSYNVFIGSNAGNGASNPSNRLYIESSANINPLIYGEFDNDLLRINGELQIKDEYTFPLTDGTVGQALMTNGAGDLTWGSTSSDLVTDDDGDTKIQVELNADEDIIRFSLNNTQHLTFEENIDGILMMNTTTLSSNFFLGRDAGLNTNHNFSPQLGYSNIFIGDYSGSGNSTGNENIYIGSSAGRFAVSGNSNIYFGNAAGNKNTSGDENVFLGDLSGHHQTSGDRNVYMGTKTGILKTEGSENVFLGYQAGMSTSTGSGNVFIGYDVANGAGLINNKLYIDNSNTTTPLIYGEFDDNFLKCNGDFSTSGNLGIGLDSADELLHIFKSGNDVTAKIEAGSAKIASLELYESSDFGFEFQYNGSDDKLHLWSRKFSGNEGIRMTWEKNGQVGLGIENPTAKLHIKQTTNGDEALMLENDGNTNTWAFEIGTNNMNLEFNGTDVGYWDDATGNYTATSDRRLKKDISYLNENILDRVTQLAPATYRLNHAKANTQKTIGFIAQDVQKLFPELVKNNENEMLGLHYADFGVLAIKAIQEQQELINIQETKILTLSSENESLKNALNDIVRRLELLEKQNLLSEK